MVKEELVRVTTEPIIDPTSREASREAQQWIQEADEENYETDENEDEELTKIENQKEKSSIKAIQNGKHNSKEESSSTSSDQDSDGETPRNGEHDSDADDDANEDGEAPVQERGVDVCFARSPRFSENLQNNKSISKSTGDVRAGFVKRNTSFSNKNMNRSISVVDVAKKFENSSTSEDSTDKGVARSTSTSNLQRKRSFTRSTDRSFVGSIRDRFRSSLRGKKNNDKESESSEHNAKAIKKEEVKSAESGKNTDKKESNAKRVTSKASFRVENSNSANKKSSNRYGGSSNDVRDSSKNSKTHDDSSGVNKKFSSSSADVRASFRTNSTRPNTGGSNRDQEVRGTYRANATESKSSFVRSTGGRHTGSSHEVEVRSSVRRNNASNATSDIRASIRKSTGEKDATAKTTTPLTRTSTATGNRNSTVRASLRENKKGTGIRRSNSRAGATPRNQTSANSSAQSTPTVSRENSKTNLKIPIRCRKTDDASTAAVSGKSDVSQQEKDLLRIAKAFQLASHEVSVSKDNIEKFMVTIATDDIEPCTNNRLNIDDLYDHIRHRMILSQHEIFEGYRSDVRLDMSKYFDLLFTALASHMNRVGCEIVTDSTTQQKVCYLTHIKLVDYAEDLEKMANEQLEDEDTQASYV